MMVSSFVGGIGGWGLFGGAALFGGLGGASSGTTSSGI